MKIDGSVLRRLRLYYGLRQIDLSYVLHVDPSLISHFERGVFEPSIRQARQIAYLFDTNLFVLCGEEPLPDIIRNSHIPNRIRFTDHPEL